MSPANEDKDSSRSVLYSTHLQLGAYPSDLTSPPAAANPKLSLEIQCVHQTAAQRIKKPTSEAKKEGKPNIKVSYSTTLASPSSHTPFAGIRKTSSSIETDHTPHAQFFEERVYLDCVNLRIIYAFLTQNIKEGNQSAEFRTSAEYCPSLAATNKNLVELEQLRWVKVAEKNNDDLKRALAAILEEVYKANHSGKNEFLYDRDPRNLVIIHAQKLREMLLDNPKSKEKIAESATLRHLYRKCYIACISPHAEIRVLEDTAEARKTIFTVFLTHQIDQIYRLRSVLRDEQGREAFHCWNENTKKLHLQKIYTCGLSDEFLSAVLYREQQSVYAHLNKENTRSLEPFFQSTSVLANIFLNTLKPLTDSMSFHSYINSLSPPEKKEMEKHLQNGELRLILGHLAKNQLSEWENQKSLLMIALLELADRACWLAKQLGKNPDLVQRHEESLKIQKVKSTGYRSAVIIIKSLANILKAQSPPVIKQEV